MATAKAEEQRALTQVGSLLCYRWGCEQTNVQYYEVVARSKTGATVTLREIEKRGFSSPVMEKSFRRKVTPCPGAFIGPEFKKRVGDYGVTFDYGQGRICGADDSHEETSYA